MELILLGICSSQGQPLDQNKPDESLLLKETLYGITFEVARGDICEEKAENGAIG